MEKLEVSDYQYYLASVSSSVVAQKLSQSSKYLNVLAGCLPLTNSYNLSCCKCIKFRIGTETFAVFTVFECLSWLSSTHIGGHTNIFS